MRTRANGCTRGNDTGDASGIRDGKTVPPVGPHRLLLPHRAATAAHRGLKELEQLKTRRGKSKALGYIYKFSFINNRLVHN